MIKGNSNSRRRNARHTVYNLSLAVGIVASVGLTATIRGPLVTDVYAENAVVTSDIIQTETDGSKVNEPKIRIVTAPKAVDVTSSLQGTTTLESVSYNLEKTLPNSDVNTEQVAIENPKAEPITLDSLLGQASSDVDYIWTFLTASRDLGGAGFTNAGASAIMGCIQAESGFNTEALNGTDGGFGLLQWTDTISTSRKTNLINWCNENQLDPNSILGQLKFAVHELETKFSGASGYRFAVYETLTSSESVEECLKMFFCHVEAGTDVPISDSYVYAGHSTTQDMYNNRLSYSWNYYTTYKA